MTVESDKFGWRGYSWSLDGAEMFIDELLASDQCRYLRSQIIDINSANGNIESDKAFSREFQSLS